ncbi:uncharacterized protein LOC135816745 [Sycon ciliatum]|uniref:uncharacterized protein LOC135816745 n=1 Tax=Sycon ciliatum TaxID=27933 RepID=UPI0031F6FD5D
MVVEENNGAKQINLLNERNSQLEAMYFEARPATPDTAVNVQPGIRSGQSKSVTEPAEGTKYLANLELQTSVALKLRIIELKRKCHRPWQPVPMPRNQKSMPTGMVAATAAEVATMMTTP